MNIFKFALLSLVLLPGSLLRAEPAAVPTPAPADPFLEALPILQAKYADFAALNYKPGDKFEDLIARSNGGISLVTPTTLAPTPIITAALPEGVVYWRLATFTPKTSWANLTSELQTNSLHASGAVLDLRSNDAPQDMQGAAQMMALFDPGDTALVRYNPGKPDAAHALAPAPFHGPVIVLTDQKTIGAAETLAACLKADGALVVGTPTAGRGAAFTDYKLSSGQILRYLTEHVHLANGVDLWDHPVLPDLTPKESDRNESAALTLIRDNQVLDVIQESAERHRLSEASLVHGQDPEYDDYLATLERKPVLLSLPVIHDTVLISALDSLKAIRLSQQGPPVLPAATSPAPATSASIQ